MDATPEQIWAVLADVTRIGEWSSECHGAEWLDGATVPRVGARFRGRNRVGPIRWTRVCTITEVSAPRVLAYRTRGAHPRRDGLDVPAGPHREADPRHDVLRSAGDAAGVRTGHRQSDPRTP
ncbi:SRPBCC family protein [Rhodococcus sp. CX]|uniref:SRPBCC family protein n=1 Tax=Rhodococcus sp. CX TaxID=2789880 RepID=UPI0035A819BB